MSSHASTIDKTPPTTGDNHAHDIERCHTRDSLNIYRGKNVFTHYRGIIRPYAGEFFGTMVLVIFGIGANCQVVLSSNPDVAPLSAGNWTSLSFGWAAGVALGAWISGGHINPAITLALAVWRGFPWKKVPGYVFSQFLGAFVGGAIIYGNYFHAIDIFEGGPDIRTMKTAGLFGTFPLSYMTTASCFFSEFLGTTMLVMSVLALIDKKNNVPAGLLPVGVFIVIYGISACLGFETGFALNPARDFGPRLLTSIVGYGSQVYTAKNQYWLWCPIIATSLGAQAATFLYDLFLYSGSDSLIYKKLGLRPPTEHNGVVPSCPV